MANARDIQAQMTRQRIIECMFELLSTTDYNRIRIADIAKKADISVGTFYLYFHSKSDVATTLVHERNVILTQDLTIENDLPVVEQYHNYVDAYLKLIQSDGFEFSRGIMLAMLEEYVGNQATSISLQEEYIVKLLEHGIATGELNAKVIAPKQFFTLFISSVNGTLIEWFYSKDDNTLIQGMMNLKKLICLMATA